MKKIVFPTLLCLIFGSSFSQTNNIWKRKPWEELKLQNKQKLTFSNPQLNEVSKPVDHVLQMPVLKIDMNLKKVGSINSNTDVFTVEPYHMPCIVPSKDIVSTMPVVGYNPEKETPQK